MGGLNRVVFAGAGSAVTSEGGGATGAGPAASDRPPAGAVGDGPRAGAVEPSAVSVTPGRWSSDQ
jgi:hypothetical protein